MKTTFAVSQIRNNENNIKLNVDNHIRFIEEAAKNKADFVLFPELSITGYIREKVSSFNYSENDDRLNPLREICYRNKIAVSLGIPLKHKEKYLITTLTIKPDRTEVIYAKKYLHPGEDLFYSTEQNFDPITQIHNNLISNAICFDIENKEHQDSQTVMSSNIYAASIFYSKKGIDGGLKVLSSIADRKKIPVLMSNYCGLCWETEAGGKSSVWKNDGSILVQAKSENEELLIAEKLDNEWKGRIIGM